MNTISLIEAQNNLADLIHRLSPGDGIIIVENDQPVATLVASPDQHPSTQLPRRSGTMRGTVLYMAPDFDAPVDDFKEYME